MLKMLCTLIAMVLLGVLSMVKLLPSLAGVLGGKISVSEPLRNLLTQVTVGKGSPVAVQERERGAGLRSCTELAGDIVIEGLTVVVGEREET